MTWVRAMLGEAGVRVLDCVHKTPADAGAGYPYLAIPNIKDGQLDLTSTRRISKQDFDAWTSRYRPQAGDVLVTRRGRVGDSARIPSGLECAIGQNLVLLRSDGSRVDQAFLFWYCRSPQWWDEVDRLLNVGAVFSSLNVSDIPKMRISLPPLPEQRRIAEVICTLDDAVQVNRALIRDLDALGSIHLLKELPAELHRIDGQASLAGWRMASLDEALSVLETGSRPKGGVASIQAGVPSIGAESIAGLATFNYDKVKFVSEEFYASMKKGHVASGDVLIYKDGGTPGNFTPKVAMFGEGFPFSRMAINEHVFRVRVEPPLSNAYLYFWLRTDRMMAEMRRAGTGAAIPGINRTAFSRLPIPIPPQGVSDQICAQLDVIARSALTLAREADELSRTRDELLPLLLSGQVRVSEVAAA